MCSPHDSKEMEESDGDFDRWLACTVGAFVHFPPEEQSLTVTRLIIGTEENRLNDENNTTRLLDNPEHSYRLMQSVMKNILHVDVLSNLPTELNEIICCHVQGKSLLKACSVSRNWNRIISSLHKVWQVKCTLNGFQKIVASNWKMKYVQGQRILENIQAGRALALQTIPIPGFNIDSVTSLTICGGVLYASADRRIYVWKISPMDETPVVNFRAGVNVSAMCGYEPQHLICGHTSGQISKWMWNGTLREVTCIEGHNAPILCLAVSEKLGFVASGGWDKFTKLWLLSSMSLLLQVSRPDAVPYFRHEPMSQVTIMHHLDSSGSEKFWLLSCSREFMLLHQCVVKRKRKGQMCEHGNAKETESTSTELAITIVGSKIMKLSSSSGYMIQGKLIYIAHVGNNSEMKIIDLDGKEEEKAICLDGLYHILALGKVFALLVNKDRLSHYCFTLFNYKKKCKSASWKFQPPVGNSHRHLFQVASGDSSWLDDLGHLSMDQPVLAYGDACNQITLMFWQQSAFPNDTM